MFFSVHLWYCLFFNLFRSCLKYLVDNFDESVRDDLDDFLDLPDKNK